jgi:two-component system, NtrC family, sensor kinase
MRRFLDLPLRRKLVLSFLGVIMIGGIISLIVGTRLEHRTIIDLAQAKVRHDLASAEMVYRDQLNRIRDVVRLSATREFVQAILLAGPQDAWTQKLDNLRREYGLDILTLANIRGRVVLRARRPESAGDDVSSDPFIRRALRLDVAAGTQIVPRAELEREGPDLAERAYFEFVPTPMAAERAENHEENGMMLKAASPVLDERGELIGALYGGLLFNRNYDLVDEVKNIVFKGERYQGHDIGTATIFQGDLRIATNVLDAQGQRAVGTRVSREVQEAVLEKGESWVAPAFVVRAWYITAYQPIRDIDDRIVGMLYVGMLEKPYIDLRNRVMLTFTVIAGLCAAFLILVLSDIAKNITRPLRVMVQATDQIAQGDLSHRVDIAQQDEVGHLAQSFNRMADNLAKAYDDLKQWGRTLERRVDERTQELRETQDALVQSEKLASLGKMAAGVAHEVNNPLTSILINACLLLETRKPGDPEHESLTLIAEETSRCAQIVRGLLEFARQTPSQTAHADINEIVERTVQLLEKQASVRNITILKDLDPALPAIDLDRSKMQQVFSNLVINAIEAMPSGGTLRIVSCLGSDGRSLEVRFADTGIGIPAENLHKIFDPFFTTKSWGTGLGLAVSYGIIERQGGTIEVESEVGRGTVFKVKLPLGEADNATNDTTQNGARGQL